MEDSEISCHFWHFWVTVPVVSAKAGYRRSTSAYKTFCRRLFSLRVGSRVPVLPYGAAHCRLLHNWQPFIEKVTETPAQHCNPMFVSLHILLREREHKKGISFNHGWISALRSVTFIKPSNFFDMFIVVARSSYHRISYSISCWRLSRFLAYFLNLGVMLLMGQW